MAGLSGYPAMAVLRAESLERAKKFYMDMLGFSEMSMPGMDTGSDMAMGMAMFSAGDGTMFMLYERPGMAAPENTTLGFGVPADKFDDVMSELRDKGVTFEEYDVPEMDLKTVNGVADYAGAKSAWFKDTEGNILNIATM